MNVVSLQELDQDTECDWVDGTSELLRLIDSEWRNYKRTGAMRNRIVIPPQIQGFTVCGVVYEPSAHRRVIWFRPTDTGYNSDLIFVSEAVDDDGQPWQLELDRSDGKGSDNLKLAHATRLGSSQPSHKHGGTGRRVMRD